MVFIFNCARSSRSVACAWGSNQLLGRKTVHACCSSLFGISLSLFIRARGCGARTGTMQRHCFNWIDNSFIAPQCVIVSTQLELDKCSQSAQLAPPLAQKHDTPFDSNLITRPTCISAPPHLTSARCCKSIAALQADTAANHALTQWQCGRRSSKTETKNQPSKPNSLFLFSNCVSLFLRVAPRLLLRKPFPAKT